MPRPMPAVDAPLPGMRCRHDATCGAVISSTVTAEMAAVGVTQEEILATGYSDHLRARHLSDTRDLHDVFMTSALRVREFAEGIRRARQAAEGIRRVRQAAADARQFHRTVLVVEILGNQPFTGDLNDLGGAVTEGDFSGAVLSETTTTVDAAQMSALLTMQGSDPSFLLGDQDADADEGEG